MQTGGPGGDPDTRVGRADDRRIRWYPRDWRERYGEELIALLDDEYGHHLPAMARLSLLSGGLRQQSRRFGLTGDSVPAAEGVRAGALAVLIAWAVFVIAGASFAKFSEHFDQALPHRSGAHRVPDIAYTVLQTTAGVACALVLAGLLLAAPAFLRFVRTGGLSCLRRHVLHAIVCTVLAAGVTLPLILWAHHLTAHQRNGGIHWYGLLFLLWAALIAITLALWTAVAVAIGRRLVLSTAVLTTEAALAVATTGAMLIMVGATVVWWGAVAKDAPGFLRASPGGAPGSPWDIWFVATVALMLAAIGIATVGVVRAFGVWTRFRAT